VADEAVRPGASWWVPERLGAASLADGVGHCRGCELHQDAEHGVAGEGPVGAALMLVGEQPGDQEDRAGRPFVGPAGRLLDEVLDEVGLRREDVWVTNAVKHFRWERGSRGNRLHKTPARSHVTACGPWLVAEVDLVRPRGVVLLGATAGAAVHGPGFRVGEVRGTPQPWPEDHRGQRTTWRPEWTLATVHPAAVLRSRQRDQDRAGLVADLRAAVALL
jgi:uracil-DNA glycosylase family protein